MKLPSHRGAAPAAATSSSDHDSAGENSVGSSNLRSRPLQEEISACARELWQKYGCPSGRDEAIWLEAERQLLGVDSQVARGSGNAPMDAAELRESAPQPAPATGGGRRKSGNDGDENPGVSTGQGSVIRASHRRSA